MPSFHSVLLAQNAASEKEPNGGRFFSRLSVQHVTFKREKTEMSTTLRWIIFQPLKLLRTGVLLGQLECSHLTPMAGSFSFISFHFISWRQHQWWISYFLYLKFNNSFPPPTCKWRQKRWSGPGGCFLLLINFGLWCEGRRGHSVVLSTSIPHGFCIVA